MMLKRWLSSLLDMILPKRSDYSIVQGLTEKKIQLLPRAEAMEWIHPLFTYKDYRVKAIIWELKYRENTLPLEHIGKILYEEILSKISDIVLFENDAQFVLIPVPITPQGRSVRGFNQSEYIAKSILEYDLSHTLLYAPQWLEKVMETPKQSHTESKDERMTNLRGCFKANPQIENKHIILIDDVVTTGSTLAEARETLLSVGARDVFAFTLAH